MARAKKGKARGKRAPAAVPAAQVCTVCRRDPGIYPQAKVVAKGLCNKDYAAYKRREKRIAEGGPADPEPRRSGVDDRLTVWMKTDLHGRIKKLAELCKQSESQWAANVLEKAVTRAEATLAPTG